MSNAVIPRNVIELSVSIKLKYVAARAAYITYSMELDNYNRQINRALSILLILIIISSCHSMIVYIIDYWIIVAWH